MKPKIKAGQVDKKESERDQHPTGKSMGILDHVKFSKILEILKGTSGEAKDKLRKCKNLSLEGEDVSAAILLYEKYPEGNYGAGDDFESMIKPLIVPPSLNSAIVDFEAHFAVSENEPIMILGPTGVGKSLFLYLSRVLFISGYYGDLEIPPIVQANCAHFSQELARSELFGHIKGAYTGAVADKQGLVEKANGGLLILEEIGELPFEVQAMLLTFIETGDYIRLGDNETRKAAVKIIGATNREIDLRNDFRYRFFPFYIKPLYERKKDILYYFNDLFPEITKNLTKNDVLLLLTHHWPGNVRELERIGRLLKREIYIDNLMINESTGQSDQVRRQNSISHLNPIDTGFDPTSLDNLVSELEGWDVDLSLLDSLFRNQRVALKRGGHKRAFEELTQEENGYDYFFGHYLLKFCENYRPFDEAYQDYEAFCGVFMQNSEKEKNILTTIKEADVSYYSADKLIYNLENKREFESLIRNIMLWMKDIYYVGHDWPDQPLKFWKALEKENIMHADGTIEDVSDNPLFRDALIQLDEPELMRLYYKIHLAAAKGNIKVAAKAIDLHENTFRSRMSKLGIAYRKHVK